MTPAERVARVVDLLVAVAPDVFAELPRRRSVRARGRCILSTRVAIDVLSTFGIDAEPWPMICRASTHPDRARSRRAWSVTSGDRIYDFDAAAAGCWNGHLVAHLPESGDVVDLDVGSFARPRRGLIVPKAVAFTWPTGATKSGVEGFDGHGRARSVVTYERAEDNQGFRDSIDWQGTEPVVSLLVDVISDAISCGLLGIERRRL